MNIKHPRYKSPELPNPDDLRKTTENLRLQNDRLEESLKTSKLKCLSKSTRN